MNENEWYECTICCFGTNRLKRLIEHVQKQHSVKKIENEKNDSNR